MSRQSRPAMGPPPPRRSSTPWSERMAIGSAASVAGGREMGDDDAVSVSAVAPTPRSSASSLSGRRRGRPRAAPSTTGPARDQPIVCALAESKGLAPTVGIAFVNLATAEAVLCQIADNQTYVKTLHKLLVLDPSEIVSAGGMSQSKLLPVLEANLGAGSARSTLSSNPPVRTIHRKYWNEGEGLAYVANLALPEDVEALKVALEGNFYATCCFAAAMKYIETTLSISFAFHSMRIKYEPSEGAMMIDVSTVHALELIQNAHNPRSPDCLFGALDCTLTKMGKRLLRSSILQPLIEQRVIEKRLDALEELTTRVETFVAVRKALKGFQDVDRTLTNMVIIDGRQSVQQWEHSINNVLAVKHYVRAVPAVYQALEGVSSELLVNIRQFCAPHALTEVARLIDEAVHADATFQAKPIQLRDQRIYAVKAGVNGLLDVARQTYKEANHDAYQHMLALQSKPLLLDPPPPQLTKQPDEHDLSINMKYDAPRQMYFTIHGTALESRALPRVFINRFRKKGVLECQTLALVKLNQKVADSAAEVLRLSDSEVQRLISRIRQHMGALFRISDGIAVLDLLSSFAQSASTHDYTRPEFGSTLAIRAGRHAVAERLAASAARAFVPNDTYAPPSRRLQLVTGCNMAGKSTYIRAVALVQVLAQMGSFVPASHASLCIRRQLFARVAADNSGVASTSSFAAEMRETAFILRNVSSSSLVLVDELGRGTSARDGLAIATAVAEALLQSRALVWFVTHFADLPRLLAERPGVACLHLRTARPAPQTLAMLYQVAPGAESAVHYGLDLARAIGLPDDALRVAYQVAGAIDRRAARRRASPPEAVLRARRTRVILGVREQLVQAKEGDLGGEELRGWLRQLQGVLVERLWEIEAGEEPGEGTEAGEEVKTEQGQADADAEREQEAHEEHSTPGSPVRIQSAYHQLAADASSAGSAPPVVLQGSAAHRPLSISSGASSESSECSYSGRSDMEAYESN